VSLLERGEARVERADDVVDCEHAVVLIVTSVDDVGAVVQASRRTNVDETRAQAGCRAEPKRFADWRSAGIWRERVDDIAERHLILGR
jgi:hypothetical protein